MKWSLFCVKACLCLLILNGVVGCCLDPTTFRRFDSITVSLDNSMRDEHQQLRRAEVMLFAVNSTDLQILQKQSIFSFFHENQTLIHDPIVMSLGDGHPSETFSIHDGDEDKKRRVRQTWDNWDKSQSKWLMVVAEYSITGGNPAQDDPRRVVVPLMCGNWKDEKDLRYAVTSTSLSILTPPQPGK